MRAHLSTEGVVNPARWGDRADGQRLLLAVLVQQFLGDAEHVFAGAGRLRRHGPGRA
ncbi:hypothetical protein [Actinocrispum wychmicini]|uniref:hypothetical protein n=1 Tax=Actinocrispum wychmicini TaxID=1213861 RepID=UPI001404DD6D|nr:hypothetical protein [Actinocrispum wychmicini]